MKKTYAILFAASASLVVMSFKTPNCVEKNIEAKKVNVSFSNNSNVSVANSNAKFTPLVLIALAENSVAAVAVGVGAVYTAVKGGGTKAPTTAPTHLTSMFQEIEMRKLDSRN